MGEGVKVFCDIEGLEHNFVTVSEAWTRKEIRALMDEESDEYLELFRNKVVDMHLDTVDGDPLTKPDELTEDALDNVDLRLFTFLGGVLHKAVGHLRSLGFMSGRVYSNSTGKTSTEKTKA